MDVFEIVLNDRKRTQEFLLKSFSEGKISEETFIKLVGDFDSKFYKFSIAHDEMTNYFNLANKCLGASSKPKSFMESFSSIADADSFVKGVDLLQDQQNNKQTNT